MNAGADMDALHEAIDAIVPGGHLHEHAAAADDRLPGVGRRGLDKPIEPQAPARQPVAEGPLGDNAVGHVLQVPHEAGFRGGPRERRKSQGRVLFNTLCSACHTLYGQGGVVGPDLTGAGRDNLDYLLENIADPSAVVTADFRIAVVKLKDGRTLNGFIAARTTRTLTIKSMTESQTVERADIASMPDGLLETLTSDQRRDLIAYLMHPTQVPLP